MELTGNTRLVFIIAHPVDHVRAPRIYNPAFAAAGLDWFQVPMGVAPEHLAATLEQLARVTSLQGINLTIPHKAAGHGLCHWLTREARTSGTVNTLRLEADGHWAGTNSDGIGFVGAARANGLLDVERPVFIAGAGGAATAIAFALAQEGVREIHLVDSEPLRAKVLLAALRAAFPDLVLGSDRAALRRAGLAVNATPMGLHAHDPLPLDPALLPEGSALFDIIAARYTELMAAGQARGLRVLGGRPMIDHQLAHQIAFWRGDAMQLEPSS
jgi:shikimate dehydrogenase